MLLVNRSYARLWAGQAVSQVGDLVFDTTLVLWVGTVLLSGRSYAPVAVSALLLCVAVATLVVGPLAGVFVDRWDRRRTMLRADLIRAGLVGILAAVAFLPANALPVPATLALIYAVVLLSATAAQFFNPARFALIGDVVEGDADRTRAAGIGQATSAFAAIIGPPLAAPLLFTIGLRWALLLNAVSFLVSFAAVRAVRLPGPASDRPAAVPQGVGRELLAGLRLIGGNRILRAMIVAATVVALGTGAFNALGVFFVIENLRVDPRYYGTLDMGLGIGAIVGALVSSMVASRLGSARLLWVGLLLVGIGLGVYARMTALAPALVVLTLLGIPLAAINTVVGPLVLRAAPREYVGRVMSVLMPAIQLGSILSMAVAGWLASTVLLDFHASLAGVRLGRVDSIFEVGAVLIVLGALYAAAALREVDRPDPAAEVVHASPPRR